MLLYKQIKSLPKSFVKQKLKEFLNEDIPKQDHTSKCFVSKNHKGKFILKCREKMIFCGEDIIKNIFNKSIVVTMHIKDGQRTKAGQKIATIKGRSQEILIKERVMLNLIQRLSGISSQTDQYIQKLNNPKIKILDTRKTTPGLRIFEKYAVQVGGGSNHRMDLSSGVMIKDNHLTTNTMSNIVDKIKSEGLTIPVQIEIDKVSQITKDTVLATNGFLLDNMSPLKIKNCIKKINQLKQKGQHIFIEVSGGVNLKTIQQYNISGVDGISIGALTHQVTSKDIGLDVE